MSLQSLFSDLFFNEADDADHVMPEEVVERIVVDLTVTVATSYREYIGVVLKIDEVRQDAYVRIWDDILLEWRNHWFGFEHLILEWQTAEAVASAAY